jgi:hypothetical protein
VRSAPSCFALVLALTAVVASAADGDSGAREAAASFGRALVSNNAASLGPILPEHGRIHVRLVRLGPEEGRFGASQVVALFGDFLAKGKVAAFDIVRLETDGARSALAHGKASIIDREGRSGRIGVHLGFERQGERWVLREVKETAE